MTLDETRYALSYLYSTHPHAPKLTPGDKTRMVAAYFRVLYKYRLMDVINGIDCACRKNTTYIPTAYDIERSVEKSIDIDKFLPKEYLEIVEKLGKHKYENLYDSLYKVVRQARIADDDAEKKHLIFEAENIQSMLDMQERARLLWTIAEKDALNAYDCEVLTDATHDLVGLIGGEYHEKKEISGESRRD